MRENGSSSAITARSCCRNDEALGWYRLGPKLVGEVLKARFKRNGVARINRRLHVQQDARTEGKARSCEREREDMNTILITSYLYECGQKAESLVAAPRFISTSFLEEHRIVMDT
jgi:hypothetical protein